MTTYDGWGDLPTIGDIKEMQSDDGWGELPTIGDIEEWQTSMSLFVRAPTAQARVISSIPQAQHFVKRFLHKF